MNRAEKLKKLGVETVKLIKEFREEACMLGENPLEDVYLDETNDIVIIENASKEIVEYSLSEMGEKMLPLLEEMYEYGIDYLRSSDNT